MKLTSKIWIGLSFLATIPVVLAGKYTADKIIEAEVAQLTASASAPALPAPAEKPVAETTTETPQQMAIVSSPTKEPPLAEKGMKHLYVFHFGHRILHKTIADEKSITLAGGKWPIFSLKNESGTRDQFYEVNDTLLYIADEPLE